MGETPSETPKTPEIYKCCDNPQITYLAPVNINVDEKQLLLLMFGVVLPAKKIFVKKNS